MAIDIDTPHGPARVHLHAVDDPHGALVLGHGAGGGIGAPDLAAAAEAANSIGMTVALVEQPYRVAGRRSPAPAGHLDAAWTAVVEHLRAGGLAGIPLVVGGRSGRVSHAGPQARQAPQVSSASRSHSRRLPAPASRGRAASPSSMP